MEAAIIGRSEEKIILERLLKSPRPELLALHGRRRVGKTFLISEYFENKALLFEVVGVVDSSPEIQLVRFATEMAGTFRNFPKDTVFNTWDEAFQALVAAVDHQQARDPGRKIVLFFDEAPWLDSGKSGFLSSLGYCWNRHFSRSCYGAVLVVVCGSAASWIIRNVIRSKGGLHNRVTEIIRLEPFNPAETSAFFESRKIPLDDIQTLELYMALGGVPAYLNQVRAGMSAAQIINELCFVRGKLLTEEFEQLFRSLFSRHHNHVKIIRALATVHKGLTREAILRKTGLADGGEASLFLQELEQCGFIASMPQYGKKLRGRFYRLIDEYSLFYLKWIEPVVRSTLGEIDEQYWLKQSLQPSWYAWAGYAFESICLKNVHKIKQALGISGVLTSESSWSHVPGSGSRERGAQIDLVIDRADRTINLCELKFIREELDITADYRRLLEHKKAIFRKHTGTKSLLLTTLITTHGAKEGKNYLGTVDQQLIIDCLFRQK